MTPREQAVYRANARYRAWRDAGSPVEAIWEPGEHQAKLFVYCHACLSGGSLSTAAFVVPRPGEVHFETLLEIVEHYLLVERLEDGASWCEHKDVLAGKMTDAVRQIYELELLAGSHQ